MASLTLLPYRWGNLDAAVGMGTHAQRSCYGSLDHRLKERMRCENAVPSRPPGECAPQLSGLVEARNQSRHMTSAFPNRNVFSNTYTPSPSPFLLVSSLSLLRRQVAIMLDSPKSLKQPTIQQDSDSDIGAETLELLLLEQQHMDRLRTWRLGADVVRRILCGNAAMQVSPASRVPSHLSPTSPLGTCHSSTMLAPFYSPSIGPSPRGQGSVVSGRRPRTKHHFHLSSFSLSDILPHAPRPELHARLRFTIVSYQET